MTDAYIDEKTYVSYLAVANAEEETKQTFTALTETHGFRVYRRGTVYRSYGLVCDLSAHAYAAFHEDLAYRKEWDPHTRYMELLAHNTAHDEKLHYWVITYPFPFKNRDYMYVQGKRHFEDLDAVIFVSHGCDTHAQSKPPCDKYVRVKDYKCAIVLRTTRDGHCAFFTEFSEDPQLTIVPNWLLKWVLGKAVPSFLQELKKHALKHSTDP